MNHKFDALVTALFFLFLIALVFGVATVILIASSKVLWLIGVTHTPWTAFYTFVIGLLFGLAFVTAVEEAMD